MITHHWCFLDETVALPPPRPPTSSSRPPPPAPPDGEGAGSANRASHSGAQRRPEQTRDGRASPAERSAAAGGPGEGTGGESGRRAPSRKSCVSPGPGRRLPTQVTAAALGPPFAARAPGGGGVASRGPGDCGRGALPNARAPSWPRPRGTVLAPGPSRRAPAPQHPGRPPLRGPGGRQGAGAAPRTMAAPGAGGRGGGERRRERAGRGRAARAREGAAGAPGRRAEAGGGEPEGWKPAAAAAAERGQSFGVFANVGAVRPASPARR